MKKLFFLLLLSPMFLFAQRKVIIKATQLSISDLAPMASFTVVANATGSPAVPTAVALGIGLTFDHGLLAIDTLHFKDTIFAVNGLQVIGAGFNTIGLGGRLQQATNISLANLYSLTIDSAQTGAGKGFRVNYGSDAGWDISVRDSATGYWTSVHKGTPGQVLSMLSTGGIGWGAGGGGGGGGTPAGSNTQVQFNNSGSFGASSNFKYKTTDAYASIQSGLVIGQDSLSPVNQRRLDYPPGGGGELNNILRIVNTNDTAYEGLGIYGFSPNAGTSFMHAGKARGTPAAPTGALAGDELYGLGVSGYLSDTARFSYSLAGYHIYAIDNLSMAHNGAYMEFFVNRTLQDISAGRAFPLRLWADSAVFLAAPIYAENFANSSYSGLIAQNLQGGTGATANIVATSSAGSILISARGGGYSTSGLAIQSSGVIATGSSMTGGLVIAAGGTTPIIFGNNNAQLAQFTGAGTAYYTSAGVNHVYGGSNSNIYRSTNGGSDINGFFVIDQNGASSVTTAGAGAVIIPGATQTTNPVIQFTHSNGTRRIGTSAIFGVAGATTLGSETGEMDFYTKPAGGGISRALRLNDLQNAIFGGGSTDNAAFVQIAANTTTKASMYFGGAASDVSSPTDGMLWYNSTLHTLSFRDNSVTSNILPVVQQTTLVTGTKALSITGVTTSSRAFVTLVTPTTASSTIQYQAVCTAGTVTIQANVAAGTINASDGSVLNVVVYR